LPSRVVHDGFGLLAEVVDAEALPQTSRVTRATRSATSGAGGVVALWSGKSTALQDRSISNPQQ
jgi:hypothetical protein